MYQRCCRFLMSKRERERERNKERKKEKHKIKQKIKEGRQKAIMLSYI